MTEKRMQRKLRKQCKKLLKWAKKNGVERVDVYVCADSGFMHAYIPGGESYISFMDEVRDE